MLGNEREEAVMAAGVHTFKSFPEFSRLTLGDKEAYEQLIKDYPPVYDFSFPGLMTWWNPLDNMAVARLNGNLVIPYWLAGDEKHSGLSLVGTNRIDESICAIFDYLRERGEPVKIVNVPEFVVSHIQFPDMFVFKEERKYSEYIYSISRFYPLKNMPLYWRQKVERHRKKVASGHIVVRSLDLRQPADRKLILTAVNKWQDRGINNYGHVERDSIRECVTNADVLGIENICLFVGDELFGFCLYDIPADRRYARVKHVKATHRSTLGFELLAYEFAKRLSEEGVVYINLNADFGLLRLRMFMLSLGPMNFFRKYIIEPAK